MNNRMFTFRKILRALIIMGVLALVAPLCGLAYVVWLAIVDPIRQEQGYDPSLLSEENFPVMSHERAGRRNKPNLFILRELWNKAQGDRPAEHYLFPVYHDAMGARVNGPGFAVPDVLDFAACGESASWGFGLSYDKTYVSLVEKGLGLRGANVSSIGATPLQCYFLLRDTLEYGVKTLLLYFWEDYFTSAISRCVNTHSPVCVPHPYLVPDGSGGFKIVLPDNPKRDLNLFRLYDIETRGGPETTFRTDLFWRYYELKSRILDRFNRPRQAHPPNAPHSPEKIAAMNHILGMFRDLARETGTRFVVAYIPFYSSDPSHISKLPPETEVFMRNNKIAFVDLSDDFNLFKRQGNWFSFASGHLNEIGHSLIARRIIAAGLLQKTSP